MKKLLPGIIFLLVLTLPVSLAFSQSKEEPPQDEHHKMLFETKCKKCHSLERIKKAHLTKEKAKETVKKMSKKKDANISKEDEKKIFDFLGGAFFSTPTIAPAVPAVP